MMKRTTVPRLGPDDPPPLPAQSPQQIQQAGASNMHTLAQSTSIAQPQLLDAIRTGATTMLSVSGVGSVGSVPGVGVGGGFGRSAPRSSGPAVINYLKAGAVQYAAPKPQPPQVPPRLKLFEHQPHGVHAAHGALPAPGRVSPAPSPNQPAAQFQRLKVEDALSYLDQVKYKFNTQPQVYNDFLDIMKEFKSQTIDTPGVITRVSNLFKGHPELIVGFNTFLPPGYKIEVQSNGQVSVSMPSPTGLGGGVLLGVHHAAPAPHLVQLLPVAPPASPPRPLPVPQSVSNAIVHNLSVPTPGNTLHHISQAHQQIEAASIHHTPGTVQPPAGSGPHAASTPAGQPVEFNHAIEYVNKIKSRFSRQPDKYKRFLEILHAYQRGHRDVKEPQAKQQTEQEVYSQVAKLFENQDDLLAEFGQFLPDAKAVTKPAAHYPHSRSPPPAQRVGERAELADSSPPARYPSPPHPQHPQHPPAQGHPASTHHPHHPHHHQVAKHPASTTAAGAPPQHHHLKRSPSFTSSTPTSASGPAAKKARASGGTGVRDVTYAEAAKYATLHEFSFFDRARKALRSQHVYDNFLRCLLLFTNEIISSSELIMVTMPFLCRHPELQKWLADFVAPEPDQPPPLHQQQHQHHAPHAGYNNSSFGGGSNSLLSYERDRSSRGSRDADADKCMRLEPIGPLGAQLRHDRPQGDAAMDIDLSTCKRLGTSYCALPRDAAARRCSGRTALCKEVLNDTWVSFPTWSEDSTFVTSRKTQYEEYIYRCEDERFELDVVIETNAATIRVLEGVAKKLSRMSAEEAARQRLDDCLGGHSPTIHQRALRRIYGDKAVDIIAGLKKNPVVAVPVVLRRLKAKEEEWREAQKGFNKQWREQNEKYYLKSLDHQGINFKQNDLKAMRSKSLFNEVESAYQAKRPGPHLVLDYNMHSRQEAIKILRDCTELLIHHARRQTAIQKAEKRRIKQLLRHFLPDLFAHPRQPLSDDERDEAEEKEEPPSPDSPTEPADEKPPNNGANVKQEKQESSESDNASDKSGRHNKNDKENKPKNNNNTDSKESGLAAHSVKRSGSSDDGLKHERLEPDDYRDHPPNEARFVCTSSWYLFLRLHGAVCQRLANARRTALALSDAERLDARGKHPSVAAALRLKPNNLPMEVSSPGEYYGALLELVKGVLDGNTEPAAYEDAAREMLGIKAYPAYTLDKLVSIAVRQLQHCVSEPWSVRAAELCARDMRGAPAYVRKAARYLRHDHNAFLVKVYGGDQCKVTFEMLEGPGEGRTSPSQHNNDAARLSPTANQRSSGSHRDGVARAAAWSLYAERFARADTQQPLARNKPVFLARNARRCGGYTHNVAPGEANATAQHSHKRRKPPRLHDHTECQLSNDLRLLSFRPLRLYRCGALHAARASHARLQPARAARLAAWLRKRTSNAHTQPSVYGPIGTPAPER